MDLYVKTDGSSIIEHSPDKIDGATKITCTVAEYEKLTNLRYDGETDGSKVTTSTKGTDAVLLEDAILAEEEAKLAEQ